MKKKVITIRLTVNDNNGENQTAGEHQEATTYLKDDMRKNIHRLGWHKGMVIGKVKIDDVKIN